MEKKFKKYLQSLSETPQETRFLLAVSGGVDSMVMADLFLKNELPFAVAHCNFGLREEASEEDENFVKSYFERKGISVFSTRFDTSAFAKKNKIGTQEAARTLRYEYFNQILQNADYQYIVTAHHANDNVETMLFNLGSGTGLRGMKGISARRNQYLRPLLAVAKKEVLAYAKKHALPYREDASNATNKYTRNAIRHQVVPELEKINPSFLQGASATLALLDAQLNIYDFFIKNIKKKILSEENNFIKINIETLLQYPETATILYELVKDYGFGNTQTAEMTKALQERHSGKMWFSQTHELLLDRDFFIIRKKTEHIDFQILIYNKTSEINCPNFQLQLETNAILADLSPNNIFIDVTKCAFPLLLRKWQAGDLFLPLGLKGKKKKIQDFLTDLKLNRFEKENIFVLESEGKIVWVVGLRADERFVANSDCDNILKISCTTGFSL
jgi:tRNA(Ile)-lysidine synthase